MTPPTFTPLTSKGTLDEVSADEWNGAVRDGWLASPAGQATAKGQLFVGHSTRRAQVYNPGLNGQCVESASAEDAGMKNTWGLVPVGGVILWSGLVAALPSNWKLCDGSNGTPDLRGRFVVGAGSSYAVGATGGAASVNFAHTHAGNAVTGSEGGHSHTMPDATYYNPFGDVGAHNHQIGTGGPSATVDTTDAGVSNLGTGSAHTHEITTGLEKVHSHGVLDSGSGGGHTHTLATDSQLSTESILPEYYALAYIMRVS